MSSDLFKEINNALLDLQQSKYQTYQLPLRRLARLMIHKELEKANSKLLDGIDLDKFLDSQVSSGGMLGSDTLDWPSDERVTLGLMFLLVQRFAEKDDFLLHFGHTYYYSGSKFDSTISEVTRQLIIPFVRDYKSYVMSGASFDANITTPNSNKVFIVHGHDDAARHSLARFLEKLGLQAVILQEQPNQGRTIIEKYEAVAAEVGFAVVLLTPDDMGSSSSSSVQSQRARQNVIFELGYFVGKLGRGRVCLLRKGDVEMPSDLFGVVYTELDSGDGWKHRLVAELKAANLQFDANRMWITA